MEYANAEYNVIYFIDVFDRFSQPVWMFYSFIDGFSTTNIRICVR